MNSYWLTFGQVHTHSHNGRTFDKDCVVLIQADSMAEARQIAFTTFGVKWAGLYDNLPEMGYYPRGVFTL